MATVKCLHCSMQGEDLIELTNGKGHLCAL